jgi:hypothetical protein
MVESKKILAYHRKTMSILITLITLPGHTSSASHNDERNFMMKEVS